MYKNRHYSQRGLSRRKSCTSNPVRRTSSGSDLYGVPLFLYFPLFSLPPLPLFPYLPSPSSYLGSQNAIGFLKKLKLFFRSDSEPSATLFYSVYIDLPGLIHSSSQRFRTSQLYSVDYWHSNYYRATHCVVHAVRQFCLPVCASVRHIRKLCQNIQTNRADFESGGYPDKW